MKASSLLRTGDVHDVDFSYDGPITERRSGFSFLDAGELDSVDDCRRDTIPTPAPEWPVESVAITIPGLPPLARIGDDELIDC